MTFTYRLKTERKGIIYLHQLLDAEGNIHMKGRTAEEINGNPTTTFLVDYARLNETVLNQRKEVKNIETKFELGN
jgi:hypothetical protein